MSMPVIAMHEHPISMCQAINDLIASIALEEAALSHILNAEGEKIQRAVALECSVEQLIAVNESVVNMVGAISNLENVLRDKLEFVSNNLFYPAQDNCGCNCR